MNIELNGETRTVEDNCSLQSLIEQLELSDQRIAVEINREIIPRSEHAQTSLHEGDKIEIVRAIGGGEI